MNPEEALPIIRANLEEAMIMHRHAKSGALRGMTKRQLIEMVADLTEKYRETLAVAAAAGLELYELRGERAAELAATRERAH